MFQHGFWRTRGYAPRESIQDGQGISKAQSLTFARLLLNKDMSDVMSSMLVMHTKINWQNATELVTFSLCFA
jgi:hypothetical protein